MILADLQDLLPEMATQVGRQMLARVVDWLYFHANHLGSSTEEWTARMDAAQIVNNVRWSRSLWEREL